MTYDPSDDRAIRLPIDHLDEDGETIAAVVRSRPRDARGDDDPRRWTAVFAAFLHRVSGAEHLHLLDAVGGDGSYAFEVSPDDTIGGLRARVSDVIGRTPAGSNDEARPARPEGGPRVMAGMPDLRGEGSLGRAALRLVAAGDAIALAADGRLWDGRSVRRMARQIGLLAAAGDEIPIGRLTVMHPEERQQVLVDWNRSGADWPGGTLLDLVAARVAAAPESTALVDDDSRLTFGGLASRSNQVAHAALEMGAGPGTRVGLLARRSAAFVAAAFGILKTGAAVVLLDPVNPDARLGYMVRDADVVGVLADPDQLDRVQEGTPARSIAAADLTGPTEDPPAVPITADTVSHLVYTSGSTGEPKAVLERHGALSNLVHWTARAYGVRDGDRASWLSTPGFAVQFMECLPYLGLGVEVHITSLEDRTPAQVRDWLVEHRITHTMLVAALAERVWELDWPEETALRILVTTAERVHSWPPADRPFTVVMTYGSTETTNVLTCLDIGAGIDVTTAATPPGVRAARPVPVGRPIANLRVYLLDDAGQPVPVGVVGRVHVAGAGLAAGYHRRPDLTGERFRRLSLPEAAGDPCYDTGDLGRFRPDGAVELLGRADAQVKIRGFRVELGEVETVTAAAPGVEEAAVVARPDESGATGLVAYVAFTTGASFSGADVRAHLARRLPHYMVPGFVVTLTKLPRLPNGKVHLAALPDPRDVESVATPGYVASASGAPPRTETELAVAALFEDLFRLRAVGRDDNFFSLGGHSLLAFRLLDEVRTRFAIELSLPDLFASPTVAGIAALIDDEDRAGTGGLPPLEPDPAGRFEPFPLTDSQQALWIGRGDAVALGNVGCHGYFEWDSEVLDPGRFARAWRLLVERHDSLRTVIHTDGTQQVLRDPGAYEIPVLDLRGLDGDAAAERLTGLRETLSHQVMPDDHWPLFDVRLTRYTDGTGHDTVRLHLSLDFLVSDAWSYFQVLIPDLVQLYEDPAADLPPLRMTFRDYVRAVRDVLPGSELYRRSELYWMDRIDSLPQTPALAGRPADQDTLPIRFDRRAHLLPPDSWEHLSAIGRGRGVTPSILLAQAFVDVLRSRTRQPRLALNFPLFNRLPVHPDVTNVLGDTTTTLLLAADKHDGTFAERAQALQAQLWTDLEHRYFTGVQVLRELNRRSGRVHPAMPVVMTSLLGHPPRHRPSALGRTVHSISQTPQVSVDFQVFEFAGELQFNWDFLPGVFPDGYIEAMFDDYCAYLGELADEDAWHRPVSRTLGEIRVDDEKPGNGTGTPVPGRAAAWERFWTGVRLTGTGGGVLWDPAGGREMAETLDRAGTHFAPGLPVVDVGCGNGRYTRAFAEKAPVAVGVDVSASAVERAIHESAGHPRTTYRVLDIADTADADTLGAEIGDANVFVRAVLHILDPAARAAAAETLAALSGRRGTLMLLEPNYRDHRFGYTGFAGGRVGRVAELVRPLEEAGVGSSTRFGTEDLARYFPAAHGWEVLVAQDVEMDALAAEPGEEAMRIPGFLAVLRRR